MKYNMKNKQLNEDILVSPDMNLGIDSPFETDETILVEDDNEELYEQIMQAVSKTIKETIKNI